jgi:hypothetical protein
MRPLASFNRIRGLAFEMEDIIDQLTYELEDRD